MSTVDATATRLREAVPRFVEHWSLVALHPQLPLRFPSPLADTPCAPFRARSWYTYPGWAGLTDNITLSDQGALYVALHLIDFSPLRAELVQLRGLHLNARGETPFDPVTLWLCCLLRWELGKGWKSLARFLASAEGACWRRVVGCQAGVTPAASTMRGFFHCLGTVFLTDLAPRFIHLLQTTTLLPPHTPDTDVPARDGLPLATDGMLHEAHTTMRCSKVTETCYQPTTTTTPRPCPARDAGKEGCTCATAKCAPRCRRTTPRDTEARFIHYTGRNQDGTANPRRARNVYGYRSYAHLLVDDDLHTYWVAYSTVHAANTDERTIFPTDFARLHHRLPHLPISELVADAALGFTDCLDAVYAIKAIPVIDIRHAEGDDDTDICVLRGYDAQGHPLCPHGLPLAPNGLDYQRLRAGWTCRQVCTHTPAVAPITTECPFRNPQQPLGFTTHITRAFTHPDGSPHARLARLLPYATPRWKQHYSSRRNATESRNGQLEHLGLKRLWSYGLAGVTADIALADLLINLRNFGRLVQQASALTA